MVDTQKGDRKDRVYRIIQAEEKRTLRAVATMAMILFLASYDYRSFELIGGKGGPKGEFERLRLRRLSTRLVAWGVPYGPIFLLDGRRSKLASRSIKCQVEKK
jgi:hypothetical protein